MVPIETTGNRESFREMVFDEKFLRGVEDDMGEVVLPEMCALLTSLSEIAEKTELPKFDIEKSTTTTNAVVEGKYGKINQYIDKENIFPEEVVKDYPWDIREEVKKKAPWVNLIHAWVKVLNNLNSVHAMQEEKARGEGGDEENAKRLQRAALRIYKDCVLTGLERGYRLEYDVLTGQKYAETIDREDGVEGVNPQRKINLFELEHILVTVRKTFPKGREK